MNQRATTLTLILIVGALTFCPVVMLLLGSFSEGFTAFGRFTVEKYVETYTDPGFYEVIGNTLIFVFASTALAIVLAIALAYLNNRTDIPFKSLFLVISIIPMMVPHLLFAASWALLLNPNNGILNLTLKHIFGLSENPFNIYSMWGMVVIEALLELPVCYLIIAPAISTFDVALEESSRVCGAGFWRTLTRITLPVLRPAILAAFTLGLVRAFTSVSVPLVIGMPARVHVAATYIYQLVNTGFTPDFGKAAAAGMSILGISVILIVVYRYLTAEGEKFVTVSSRGFQSSTIALRRAKYPLVVLVALLSFILIVLPVVTLVYTSFMPYNLAPSARAFEMLTLKHWISVLKDPISLLALKNSLILAIGGATVGVILSLFIAYVIVKVKSRATAVLEALSYLSFGFPGIVIGVGFMWFFVYTPLYATLSALFIGYIAAYLPYGIRPLSSAFIQLHSDLEESSRVSGASGWTTMRRIVIPLIVPGIVSAWILMSTMFLREANLSVILSRPGTEVLAVQILRFAEDGLWGPLAALGVVMIFISTLFVTLASWAGRRYRMERQ